jgi:hypothetical protein
MSLRSTREVYRRPVIREILLLGGHMTPSHARIGQVEVPHLVGLTVPNAWQHGTDVGVVVTSTDVDGPPLAARTWPGTWVVTAQHPPAGRRVAQGAAVAIEFEKVPGADEEER